MAGRDRTDSVERLVGELEGRRIGRREFLLRAGALGLSAGVASSLLAACGGSTESSGEEETTAPAATSASQTEAAATDAATSGPTAGGTLVFARNQAPSTLNPIGAADNGSIWAVPQVFDQLVEVTADDPSPVPGLAESWETSNDGLSWTFTLREAPFSNGDPVTADDVKFSIDRFADPEINSSYTGVAASIASTAVVDERTVRIDLEYADGAFLDNLAMFVPSIIPQAVYEELGDERFGTNPVGSGPFMVKSFTPGGDLELVRNPNYWKQGQPYLDAVNMTYVPDDNTRMLKVQSGEAQVASSVPYNLVDQIDGSNGISVLDEEYYAWDAIWLNLEQKPLDDLNVRLALNYATPKEAILESVLFGHAEIANHLIAKMKYWDASVQPFAYDLERAEQLLSDSSVPQGFEMNLIVTAGDVIEKQMAEIIQQEWAKIGVQVKIEQVDLGTAFGRWFEGTESAATFPTNALSSDTLSEDNLAFVFFDPESGFNSFGTSWGRPEANRLIERANRTYNEDERAAAFAELQKFVMSDPSGVALFFTRALTAVHESVLGFQTNPTGWWNLENVSLQA